MDFKDVANILVVSGNRIDNFWRYFAALNTLVIGWLISLEKSLPTDLRLALCFVYIFAALINLWTLIREYLLFEQLLRELKAKVRDTSLTEQSKALISRVRLANRVLITVFVHLATLCIIIYLILR